MTWEAVGTAVGTSALDYISGEASAKAAYARSKDAYKHRHQWEVSDLRKAGLNPILSAHQPGAAPSSPMNPSSDIGTRAINTAKSIKEQKILDLQKGKLEADIDYVNQQTTNSAIDGRSKTLALEKQEAMFTIWKAANDYIEGAPYLQDWGAASAKAFELENSFRAIMARRRKKDAKKREIKKKKLGTLYKKTSPPKTTDNLDYLMP